MMQLRCDEISKRFGEVVAVERLSLAVDSGECVAILGRSGAGKTTLLRLLSGLERLDSGCVRFDGRTVSAPGVHEAPDRRRVAMVFQDRALWQHLTVTQHFKLVTQGRCDGAEILRRLELEHLLRCRPAQLSGGQAQRLAVALALASEPDLLLLDEPRGQIDPESLRYLDDLFDDFRRRRPCTSILVSHDAQEASRWAQRVAIMEQGQVHQIDSYENLYRRPTSPVVARLTGEASLVEGSMCGPCLVETAMGRMNVQDGSGADGRVLVVLRPEHWKVCSEGPVFGRVTASYFVGGKWLTDIDCSAATIRASLPKHWPVGEALHLQLTDRPWTI